MPKILFAHQNYPSQFRELAPYLKSEGWDVLAATAHKMVDRQKITTRDRGIRAIGFDALREPNENTHRYLKVTERAVLNAQGFANMAIKLRNGNYTPDIVVAHSGWGSGSYAKAVWPDTKFIPYLEWWYRTPGVGAAWAPGVRGKEDRRAREQTRNLPFLLDIDVADAVLCPSEFQLSNAPEFIRQMTTVIHDGVDCDFFQPADKHRALKLSDGLSLPADVPILTYATRGQEPMRGFPEFMEALSIAQSKNPHFHTLIMGTDTVHYGSKLPEGESYRQRALDAFNFDHDRLTFLERVKLSVYRDVLQCSDAHVYLTNPFVLSWSCIEAMAVGCPIITNRNASTLEALPSDDHALFVDKIDPELIASAILDMLADRERARAYGRSARAHAMTTYDKTKLLPLRKALFENVLDGGTGLEAYNGSHLLGEGR